MVATTHWLASAAGMAVLEQGGNAFDAAVAAGFTLQVVEPHLNGPGGDLPALVWPVERDRPLVLCAQGPAPRAATIERYRDELGLALIPGTGPLSAVVPGAFGGWIELLREYGTLPLHDVLHFAIGYAEDGYPAIASIGDAIRKVEQLFTDDWTTCVDIYLPAPEAGALHRNRKLAETYRRILAEAEAASHDRDAQLDAAQACWYRGFVAEEIVRFQQHEWLDSSGDRHAGLLAEEDLRDWAPTWEEPLSVDYHGYEVFKAGPWSQGPVFLQQLRLLEGFDLGAMGQASTEWVHTITECAKLAFADREAWYGDPEFTDVPLADLLSRDYAEKRRPLLGEEASPELRPGSPGGREPRLARPVENAPVAPGVGEPTRGDTVHLDVVDRWGNMVSATPSGGWLWGAPVIPSLGFPLGTRGADVLARGGTAELARARQAATDDALADDRRPRRRVVTGSRHARGRPAGSVDAPRLPRPCPPRPRPPGRDRRAEPSHRGVPVELLSAREPSATRGCRGACRPPRRSTACGGAGTTSRCPGPGSLGRVTAVAREPDGILKAGANPRGRQGYAAGR